jgi:DNA-binding response OmpR family regulator
MTVKNQNHTVSALAVGEFEQDRPLLQKIFRDLGWRLFEARDRRRAMQYLERHPVHVVITESELPSWNWRKVLNDIRRLAQPPQLIVTSRTADDYLWAEVLNFGGYDVLPQPFERDEVERVIASAYRHHAAPPVRASATRAATPIVA